MGDDWTVCELIRVLFGADVAMNTKVRAKVWISDGVNGKKLFDVDSFHVMNDRDNGGLEIFCQVESENDDAP